MPVPIIPQKYPKEQAEKTQICASSFFFCVETHFVCVLCYALFRMLVDSIVQFFYVHSC